MSERFAMKTPAPHLGQNFSSNSPRDARSYLIGTSVTLNLRPLLFRVLGILRMAAKDIWSEKALVRIGKRGLTPQVVEEIKRHLKERKIIKVRLLKPFLEREDQDRRKIAELIAREVGAELVGIRGHVFVLRKARRR